MKYLPALLLAGCAPMVVTGDFPPAPDGGWPIPDLSESSQDMSPRLVMKLDPDLGRKIVWDNLANTPCYKEPLSDGNGPLSAASMYCVPDAWWNGLPATLNPSVLMGQWWLDEQCKTMQIYGMYVRYAPQAHPAWAYDYEENTTPQTARVWSISQIPLGYTLRFVLNDGICRMATTDEINTVDAQYVSYRPLKYFPPSTWVDWDEAAALIAAQP